MRILLIRLSATPIRNFTSPPFEPKEVFNVQMHQTDDLLFDSRAGSHALRLYECEDAVTFPETLCN